MPRPPLKTHCVHGHSLADAFVHPGKRNCRTCSRMRSRKYRGSDPDHGKVTTLPSYEAAKGIIDGMRRGLTWTQLTTGKVTKRTKGPINREWFVCDSRKALNLLRDNRAFAELVRRLRRKRKPGVTNRMGARALAMLTKASRGNPEILSKMTEAYLTGKLRCRHAAARYDEYRQAANRDRRNPFGGMDMWSLDFKIGDGATTAGDNVTMGFWQ